MFKSFQYFALIILFIFSANSSSNAEIIKQNQNISKAITVAKWEVADIAITNKSKIENPFDVELFAVFTNKEGQTQKVPGFYNGNGEWIIRFSASVVGEWSYTTECAIKNLNGKKGKVNVVNPTAGSHHGAVVLNPKDPQHFYYEDGTPYFLLAFECDWLFALDYHDKNAIPKTEHLLNLLNKNGLNQIVMNVFSYDVNWKKDEKLKDHPEHEFGSPTDIFPFLGNNKKPDYSQLNPEFFQKLDRTISMMHDKNIVSHLMIYVWNKLVAWPDMNSKADNMYFDYVVKRYQAFPNIVWDISKEALYYGRADQNYILERIERVRKADSFKRLVSVHDYKFCKTNPDKVDFISRQEWGYTLYNNMLIDYNLYKTKPIFNIEHGGYERSPYTVFEGFYTSPEACLRRNYECVFAGAYSTYYWQGTSWNALIYNPYEQPKEFEKPKFEYYKYMAEFFQKFEYSKFKPMPHRNMSGFCMGSNDGDYLYYMPKDGFTINSEWLFKITPKIDIQWFNTLTGEYTPLVTISNGKDIHSPWEGEADVILYIKSKTL